MKLFLAILALVVLLAVCVFHFYWAFGGKIGYDIALPADKDGYVKFQPTPAMALVVAILLLIAFLILLFNILNLQIPLLALATKICFVVFLLRSIYGIVRYLIGAKNNKILPEKFKWEICCFTPICLILALGFGLFV